MEKGKECRQGATTLDSATCQWFLIGRSTNKWREALALIGQNTQFTNIAIKHSTINKQWDHHHLDLDFLTDFSFKNSRRGITAIKPKRSGHSFKPSSITKEPLPLSLQWPIADSANGKSSFWFASFGRFILSAFLSLSLFTFRNLFWGAIRRYYFSFSLSFCLFSFDCSGFVISLVFGSWETTWENLLWNFRNYFTVSLSTHSCRTVI